MRPSFATVLILFVASAQAADCRHEKKIDATLDLAGADRLVIEAAAGDLVIAGDDAAVQAHIQGRVCVSKEAWLSEAGVETDSGSTARIAVTLPDTNKGWNLSGGRYASIDLEITVPAGLELEVRDSSGDMVLRGTGPVSIEDSSGSIEARDIKGRVTLEDSSGGIELRHIHGDVLVRRDSSGGIDGRDIRGSVRVEHDSSGEIRFEDVGGDFIVERDSSGAIIADTIGGDFRVLRDSSGGVRMTAVAGEVEVAD